jgi:hypothetical protein
MEILTEEEARERPAARAREEPNDNPKLEVPQSVFTSDSSVSTDTECFVVVYSRRPETSFLWFSSPFRTFKNIIWRKAKWYILGGVIMLCFVIFLLLFLWAMPVSLMFVRSCHVHLCFLSLGRNLGSTFTRLRVIDFIPHQPTIILFSYFSPCPFHLRNKSLPSE